MAPALLTARGLCKSFGATPVLTGVDLELFPGEVHVLMGENGAGKSTLLKILSGIHSPDSGEIEVNGKPIVLSSPLVAQEAGIALLPQEPSIFPDLSVAENIFMGRQPLAGPTRAVAWRTMQEEARRLLVSLGVSLDPREKMGALSLAAQGMVEMARALSLNAQILILDEPTAALSPEEARDLFRVVSELRARGVAIVFVSHRLDEVFEIGDRITVLRDGRFISTLLPAQTDADEVIRLMVGREASALYQHESGEPGEVVLDVRDLSRAGFFHDVSLQVRSGEIVGMAGLVGAGRTEVCEAIFGVTRADSGEIHVNGDVLEDHSAQDAVKRGLAYVPEDRNRHGLIQAAPISHNITLPVLREMARLGVIDRKRERATATEMGEKLQLRAARDVDQAAGELSGGNAQKVVLAKWLLTKPRVLILDEPTRGIDIGAKVEVHRLIGELAHNGMGILMVSSDLPEVLAMSDRVLVMREGQVAGEFSRGEASPENVMAAATLHAGEPGSVISDEAVENSLASPKSTTAPVPKVGSTPEPAPAPVTASGQLLETMARFRETGILAVLLVLVALVSLRSPQFLSVSNARSIMLDIPLILVIAMGMTTLILSRNIDLSVGSTYGLCAIVVGMAFKANPNLPIGAALLMGIALGAILGAVNGALVTWGRVPAIIATLGTLSVYRGLVFIVSGGRSIEASDLPPALISLSQGSPIGVPWIVLFALVIVGGMHFLLRSTRYGRALYAIGSNPAAARVRGLPIDRTIFGAFTLTGSLAGLAGVMAAARYGFVYPATAGVGVELGVIAATIIGGTNILGGSASAFGTVLGCVLLGTIQNALVVSRLSAFWQLAIYGAIILFAVAFDALIRRGLDRIALQRKRAR
ncbi:ribose import ATP-binding protein RbsA [Abditibacteriota bacterium]|nr:ribose import ATP-binding protein RbsA [Abditibacteriota bacterium]